jgi:hypothetical protein
MSPHILCREPRLGIRDLFRTRASDEVLGTKVLVASLNSNFAELAACDYRCYFQFYPNTTQKVFETGEQLLNEVGNRYDIVHLFCDVTPDGSILDSSGHTISPLRLIQRCVDSDLKLLWIASENKPEGYIKGFKTAGKPLNLVLTIDRRESRFTSFLEGLLKRMSSGETMPVAWVALSPQNSNDPRTQAAPSLIFAAGRGGVKLR